MTRLRFVRKSRRVGEKLYICVNGHRCQSRGVGVYQVRRKDPNKKVPCAVRVYPGDLADLKRRGVGIQSLLDKAIREVLQGD